MKTIGIIITQFSHHSSTRYAKIPEKQDWDLKSHLMMFIENFKMKINNYLKEIQENTGKKKIEALKDKTQKLLKEL